MSKAILVIDVPKGYRVEDLCICDAELRHSRTYGLLYHVKRLDPILELKPMPEKMTPEEYAEKLNAWSGDYYENVIGWNACIDEILGDTE